MRSAGNLLGTTRSDQPGPSRVVSGGRTATISGGALSSLPVQNTHGPPRGRTGSMLKSVGRRARSVEMITQRPTTGSLRSSGTAALERRVFARGRAAEERRQRVGGGLAVEEHGGDLGADRQRDAVTGRQRQRRANRRHALRDHGRLRRRGGETVAARQRHAQRAVARQGPRRGEHEVAHPPEAGERGRLAAGGHRQPRRSSSLIRTWRTGSKPLVAETMIASRRAGTVASVAAKNSEGTTITMTSAPSTAAATSPVASTPAGRSKSGM